MRLNNLILLISAAGITISLTACGSGGGDPNNVPKQNNLPQVACSASFGGGWESLGTISYNPPLSPTALGYFNQFIYYDNRSNRFSTLISEYGDASGNWNGIGSIVKQVPVYSIGGGTGDNGVSIPPDSQWPNDVCSYMGSTERYTSNNHVVPETINHGVMAWKNCSASIANGVMTFNANYEFYLNSLNTVPVESGAITFTCNNINNVQPPKPLPLTSTSSKVAQTINDHGGNFAKYIDSLRSASTQN